MTGRVRTRNPWLQPGPRFVGRTELVDLLLNDVATACGQSRVVVVHGAAGIGKSRLLREFHSRMLSLRDADAVVVHQSMRGQPDLHAFISDLLEGLRRIAEYYIYEYEKVSSTRLSCDTKVRERLSEALKAMRTKAPDLVSEAANQIPDLISQVGGTAAAPLSIGIRACLKLVSRFLPEVASSKTSEPTAVMSQLLKIFEGFSQETTDQPACLALILDQWDEIRMSQKLLNDFGFLLESLVAEVSGRADLRLLIVLGVRSEAISYTCGSAFNLGTTGKYAVPVLDESVLRSLLEAPYPAEWEVGTPVLLSDEAVDYAASFFGTQTPLLDVVEICQAVWHKAIAAGERDIDLEYFRSNCVAGRRELVRNRVHTFYDLVSRGDIDVSQAEARSILRALALSPLQVTPATVATLLPREGRWESAIGPVLKLLSEHDSCRLLFPANWIEDWRWDTPDTYQFRHGLIQEDLMDCLGITPQDRAGGSLYAAALALHRSRSWLSLLEVCAELVRFHSATGGVPEDRAAWMRDAVSDGLSGIDTHASGARVDPTRIQSLLEGIGELAVPALVLFAEDRPHSDLKRTVLEALSSYPYAATEIMTGALSDDDDRVKAMAVDVLGRSRDPDAITPLLRVVKGGSKELKRAAIGALASFRHERVVHGLLEVCRGDDDWLTKRTAQQALSHLGVDYSEGKREAIESAYEEVMTALGPERDIQTRIAAIQALAEFSGADALAALVGILGDEDHFFAEETRRALEGANPDIVIPLLIEVVNGGERNARLNALRALRRIGDSSASSSVVRALHDQSWPVQAEAVLALCRIGDPGLYRSLPESLAEILNSCCERPLRSRSGASSSDTSLTSCKQALATWLDQFELGGRGGCGRRLGS